MSTDLNMVALTGRLVRDGELKYTSSGTAVLNVTIAVNEGVKNADGSWEDKGNFFDLAIWGQYAERIQEYMTKGRQVSVQGRLKQHTWTDQQTGQNRSKVDVQVSFVQLLAVPGENGGSNNHQNLRQDEDRGPQNRSSGQYGTRTQSQPRQQDFEGVRGGSRGFDPPARNRGYSAGPEHFDDDIPF